MYRAPNKMREIIKNIYLMHESLCNIKKLLDAINDEKNVELGNNYYSELDKPIADLELSPRSERCFKQENIHSVGDLIKYTPDELLKVENFGRKSLRELEIALNERGIKLKENT